MYSSVIRRADDDVEVESSGLVCDIESVEDVPVVTADAGDGDLLHGGVPGGV